jgi:hypothetical protein
VAFVAMLTVAAGSYFWLAYGFSGLLGQLQNVAVVASLAAVALWAREALAWRRTPVARLIAHKHHPGRGDPAEAIRVIAEDDRDGPAWITHLLAICLYAASLDDRDMPAGPNGPYSGSPK